MQSKSAPKDGQRHPTAPSEIGERVAPGPSAPEPQASLLAGKPPFPVLRNSYVAREWGDKENALRHLTKAGFTMREDLSFAPPERRKRLTPTERRAIEYLVLNWGFIGLLTDAQHAERERQNS